MNEKLLPWLLLFCALGLSSTAAYYSVSGLATIFTGVTIPIIIMGAFLEVSKVVTATYLHNYWKKTYLGLKFGLTIFLLVLMVITSLGIYGLLSKGFQENISGLEIDNKRIGNVEIKKNRFIETKSEYIVEKENVSKDVSQLREALANGTMTQYKDRETGEIITIRSSSARRVFEKQLGLALDDRGKLSLKIEALNDSITNLDLKVLDMQIESETESELGVIKYVNEVTGIPIKKVANIFILMIIFVFDPLAILLVIATNQAFKNLRPKKNIYGEVKKDWSQAPPSGDVQKKIEIKLEEELPPQIPQPTATLTLQEQIQYIRNQINIIQNSQVSDRKKLIAIEPLNTQITRLQSQIEGEQKTY